MDIKAWFHLARRTFLVIFWIRISALLFTLLLIVYVEVTSGSTMALKGALPVALLAAKSIIYTILFFVWAKILEFGVDLVGVPKQESFFNRKIVDSVGKVKKYLSVGFVLGSVEIILKILSNSIVDASLKATKS